jgi:hypothetical protein
MMIPSLDGTPDQTPLGIRYNEKDTNVALRKAFKVRYHMVELRGPTSGNKEIGNTVEVLLH